jgi:aerobic-type carbon monoxide dehydrogenase small subunit (CoxS/CutS family)
MQLTINAQRVEATFDVRTSLLDLLRDHLGPCLCKGQAARAR